jgi:Mn-containing catalase
VFAPDYAPEEVAAIAEKLRKQAGLPKEPTGEIANGGKSAPKARTTRRKTTAKR